MRARRLMWMAGLACVAVSLLGTPAVRAATGDVISSFDSIDKNPNGVAWDGSNLWLAGESDREIREVTTSGTLLSSFDTDVFEDRPNGITWDGNNLWIAGDQTRTVYEVTTSGTIVSSFSVDAFEDNPWGLTWDGTDLWLSGDQNRSVYRFTTSGTLVSSFSTDVFDDKPRGLTWDGTYFWLVGDQNNSVYQLTTSGTLISSFATPCGSPKGLTIDGTDFRLSCDDGDLIYRLEGPNQPPLVTLSKSVDLATAVPADTIVYTLTYGNTGLGNADNLVITDTIPINSTLVPGSITDGGIESLGVITWSLGTLPALATGRTVQFSVTVDSGTPPGSTIDNSATADYEDTIGNPQTQVVSNTTMTDVLQVGGVSVESDQTSSVRASTGTQATYTLTIANTGNGPDWFDLTILKSGPQYWPTELLDAAGTTLLARDIDADGVWEFVSPAADSDSDGVPDTGSLAGGASIDVTLRLTVPGGTSPGHIDTTRLIAVSNFGPAPRATDGATTITGASSSDLRLTKTDGPDPSVSGGEITYTMTYSNEGQRNSNNVVLTDSIPADSSFVAGSASGEPTDVIEFSVNGGGSWGAEPADPTTVTDIRWIVGEVPKNSGSKQASFRVVTPVTLPNGSRIDNTAILQSDEQPDIPATAATTISAAVLFTNSTKQVSASQATPDQTLTYTFFVRNDGVQLGSGVELTDTVPPGTSYVPGSITGTGGNDSGLPNLVWTLGSVPGGAVLGPLTFQVTVDNPVAANTFSIQNVGSIESNQTNPTDTSSTFTLVNAAPLLLTSGKSSRDLNGGALATGDEIGYTVQVVNSGNMDATGVLVTDTVPPGTTYVPGSIGGAGADDSLAPNLRWNVGNLAGAGASTTLTFRVSVDTGLPLGTLIANVAQVSSDQTAAIPTPATSNVVGGGMTGFIQSTTPIVAGDAVTSTVTDSDLDTDPATVESFALTTTNTVNGETESLTYTETAADSGIFRATFATVFGAVAGTNDDGTFNVQSGDTLETIYSDALTAAGGPGSSTATTLVVGGGATGTIVSTDPILAGGPVTITLTDADLDADPGTPDTLMLTTSNTVTGEQENLTYTETGAATGIFTASVSTVFGTVAGTDDDGSFNVQPGDSLLTVYNDAVTASGGPGSASTTTNVIAPELTLTKSVSAATAAPGDTITYTVVHTNPGPVDLFPTATIDPCPNNTDFQLGSATLTPGTSGVTAVIAFSDDGGATFIYTPLSGGGGASPGYDRNVTHVRFTFSGTLGMVVPDNSFQIDFAVRIR